MKSLAENEIDERLQILEDKVYRLELELAETRRKLMEVQEHPNEKVTLLN